MRAKSLALLAAVLFSLASLSWKAQAQDDSWEEDFQSAPPPGRRIFTSTCAGCHGLDGHGGERAPNIASSTRVLHLSDAQVSNVISNGVAGTGMPAFHTLTPAQVKALVSYIRILQGKPLARTLPGDPVAGKGIFFGKGECSSCHSVKGDGGFIGPDLTAYGAAISAEEIGKNLTRPNRIVPAGYKAAAITMKDGSRVEGLVRNEDNFSLQLLARDGSFHFFEKADLQRLEYAAEPLMPTDYGKRLTHSELNDLISYLMTAGAAPKSTQNPTTPKKSAE